MYSTKWKAFFVSLLFLPNCLPFETEQIFESQILLLASLILKELSKSENVNFSKCLTISLFHVQGLRFCIIDLIFLDWSRICFLFVSFLLHYVHNYYSKNKYNLIGSLLILQYGSYQRRLLVEDLNKKWKQVTLQTSVTIYKKNQSAV